MINSSIFTYFPPFHNKEPNRAFLGFSRYEKEEQITQEEAWKKITHSVSLKVFNTIKKKYNPCGCCLDSIQFAWDGTEIGIVLKKIEPPKVRELSEMSLRHVDTIQKTTNGYPKEILERIRNFSLNSLSHKGVDYSHPTEARRIRQIGLNEFAVTTLCEMSIESGIEKPRILEQVQKARNEGYLSQESFDTLQRTVLKS